MFSLELECRPEEVDLLVAELWEHGCAGIVELSEGSVRAFFEAGADRAALESRFSSHNPRWRAEEDRDWVAYSREKWEPLAVGRRFFLAPQWRADPTPPGRLRIEVNPGMAFGTGVHETTQLCLEALEGHLQPGCAVLDVGTGSGILAHAAILLGAGKAWGCDVDDVAVRIARDRAARAGVEARFFTGSADAVRTGCADIALANISPEAIRALASELARCIRPGGILIASGFERDEARGVRAVLEAAGLEAKESDSKGEWALVAARRASAAPATRTPGRPERP